jgi:outer membrane protein
VRWPKSVELCVFFKDKVFNRFILLIKIGAVMPTINNAKQHVMLAVVLVCGVLHSAVSQAAPLKLSDPVFVVDMQRVLEDSIAGKAARNDLEKEVAKLRNRMGQATNELKRLDDEMKRQASLLSEAALNEKREAIANKEREYSRVFNDQQEELKVSSQRKVGKIVEHAQTVITKLTEARGGALVVERGQGFVAYVDPKLDLTADVVKELNKESLKF